VAVKEAVVRSEKNFMVENGLPYDISDLHLQLLTLVAIET
jgi:hypothetical protein